MTLYAEFSLPTEALPFHPILSAASDVRIELVRVIPTGPDVFPYFRVSGADEDLVVDVLANHDAFESVHVLGDDDGGTLFQSRWTAVGDEVLAGFARLDIALLSATGTADGWTFKCRVPTRDCLSAFQAYCESHEIQLELRQLRRLRGEQTKSEGLTDAQRETLLLAFHRGYFDVPREASLDSLAEEFGISRQAVADRLRRGYRNLVRRVLIEP
ncbi:bacterio-opsin activator domain-containing protein [Haloprofundus halobius]|uniref:helix-turn-helix domain-containing protein n=1 Tax=Haloprofundus halobius TaxID=2876194 RepID=UPI001CD01BF0|nr:helix-turn-helix domain-containing protein [Haloprofundus halobius]